MIIISFLNNNQKESATLYVEFVTLTKKFGNFY